MCDSFIIEDNLSLRPIHREDKNTFLKWHNDAELRKMIGGLVPFSEAEFIEVCQMKERTNPPNIWFAICVDGRVIGISGLHKIKYLQRNAEVSIFIGEKSFRNRGIATKTMKMLEDYAFGCLQMHRIYAYVFADNEPSVLFFNKCGWAKEGILKDASYWNGQYRDVLLFSMLNLQ